MDTHVHAHTYIPVHTCTYLDIFWEEVLMDDSSLLEVVHYVHQLVHVFEDSLRRQSTLWGG